MYFEYYFVTARIKTDLRLLLAFENCFGSGELVNIDMNHSFQMTIGVHNSCDYFGMVDNVGHTDVYAQNYPENCCDFG